ncbi:MAG TPA: spondin domain-containing protein [Gemmatimonadales bacterium]|nr:spondin domain-containing protein [Gemmatimonadales bacterium]
MFTVTIQNVGNAYPFIKSGIFNTPFGATAPGPIGPGAAYEFSFTAPKGAKLSLATMFVPSNDFFYAPDTAGIALYNPDGSPVSGDVTDQFKLWDAGTEINQEPGLGPDQPQRQAGPNTGAADPDSLVRVAPDSFGNLPAVNAVLKVVIAPGPNSSFTVRVENVSNSTTLSTSDGKTQAVPLAPGVWVVHTDPAPLFRPGTPDRHEGLEALAEDGNPAPLGATLASRTGITVPLAPGVYAVSSSPGILYTSGQPDLGVGLEALAEDGKPATLAAALAADTLVSASGAFATPVGGSGPGAIGPGQSYQFSFQAVPGENLSLATMFVPSNDLFYAPSDSGIPLFNGSTPISGDVTAQMMLWDAGTEVNQEPGVGPDQPQRQAAPNTGTSEQEPVEPIGQVGGDAFTYPKTGDIIKVTITSQ